MVTRSHRTTRDGTIYTVECVDCGAVGGVTTTGRTYGAVLGVLDERDQPDDGPVTCDGCDRDRRLSPFLRERDGEVDLIWLCPDCAPNRGGDTDE